MPKTSAKELAKRKKAAQLHDEHRQWIEAKIAEMGQNTAKTCDELDLWIPNDSPAMEFLFNRLNGVRAAYFDDAMHRAVVDLLDIDIPLDRRARQLIAVMYWRLAFPNPAAERKRQRRAEALAAELAKRCYRERGMTALEADQQVADDFGLTVGALTQRKKRAAKGTK